VPYSYGFFKNEIADYMSQYMQSNSIIKILDVGPGCGTYGLLLNNKNIFIDAVEIFEPNINRFGLRSIYKNIYLSDIRDFDISNYEFIIMGDVLEHLSVDDAQKIIKNINDLNIKCMIAIPYKAPQGSFEGNDAEIHLQDDLTKEIMDDQYPSLKLVFGNDYYGYYVNFDNENYISNSNIVVNDRKIQFITCVSDEKIYYICKLLLKNLDLPLGYTVEYTNVNNVSSIAFAHNLAISSSDAKYRVYLNENVFITNKNFISDVIDFFINNPKIGMIGGIGCKKLPQSGVWQEAEEKFGKIYKNQNEKIIDLSDIIGDYEQVEVVDGSIMMTQYDVQWREDLFNGLYFYDVSQCLEFKKWGYSVAILKNLESWYICNKVIDTNGYEEYRLRFIQEYFRSEGK